MTSFQRKFIQRCAVAGACGGGYTALVLGHAWFTEASGTLTEHAGQVFVAALMAIASVAMVSGLEYVLTPDWSAIPLDETVAPAAPAADANPELG